MRELGEIFFQCRVNFTGIIIDEIQVQCELVEKVTIKSFYQFKVLELMIIYLCMKKIIFTISLKLYFLPS